MPVLQFKGKSVIETYHHVVPHHRLEFVPKLSVLPKGTRPSLDGNLIIEGDNLLALKAMLPTHAGKVKCIYIDPPYNTGNEGWVYNDNLTQPQFKEWIGQTVGKEGEDACRHDKWCCMMYPRLTLLKELLREDGAIFISIDDNEVHHLRMLTDEVFGPDNFVATVIWEKVYSPKSSARYFSANHDFIVIYAKSKADWELGLLPRTDEANARYENPDKDSRGRWKPSDLSARNPYSKGTYSIKCPGGRVIKGPPGGNYWRYSEEKFWAFHADNRIWWGEDKNQVPAIKRFLTEVKQGLVPETIWTYKEVGHTQDAKKTVLEVLGNEQVFLTPKPVELLKRIIRLSTEENDLILDSFAGSGTTAHAVLELNKEDGGNRNFVLVQMSYDIRENEKDKFNICREVTAERVRRVMLGYTFANGEKEKKIAGLGGSFTYVHVGERLFGEYRDLGEKLPDFEQLARYIFYTETSRDCDPAKFDPQSGFIGSTEAAGGTSYYLLYTPNHKEDREMSTATLAALAKRDKNRNWVIYCEKIWLHQDQLRKFELEHGRHVRAMLVPFNLK